MAADKIDLGKLSDRELSLVTAQTVNSMDEKLDTVCKTVATQGQLIAEQKVRCDSIQNCPPNSKIGGFNRPVVIVSGSAIGGGMIVALVDTIVKRIFGG